MLESVAFAQREKMNLLRELKRRSILNVNSVKGAIYIYLPISIIIFHPREIIRLK